MEDRTQRWVCGHCGKPCERPAIKGQRPKWCSPECASHAGAARKSGRLGERECDRCRAVYLPTYEPQRYCSLECSNKSRPPRPKRESVKRPPRDTRSPLRRAIEDVDAPAVLAEVRLKVEVDPATECWVWQGLLKDGYAIAQWGKSPTRMVSIHRAVLEASIGAPLGVRHAHHVCANKRCVNPEHLQPVTHCDNSAEMLARRSYVARIAELEAALAAIAPSHPLLDRAPLAG